MSLTGPKPEQVNRVTEEKLHKGAQTALGKLEEASAQGTLPPLALDALAALREACSAPTLWALRPLQPGEAVMVVISTNSEAEQSGGTVGLIGIVQQEDPKPHGKIKIAFTEDQWQGWYNREELVPKDEWQVRVHKWVQRWERGEEEGEPTIEREFDEVQPWHEAVGLLRGAVSRDDEFGGESEGHFASINGPWEKIGFKILAIECLNDLNSTTVVSPAAWHFLDVDAGRIQPVVLSSGPEVTADAPTESAVFFGKDFDGGIFACDPTPTMGGDCTIIMEGYPDIPGVLANALAMKIQPSDATKDTQQFLESRAAEGKKESGS